MTTTNDEIGALMRSIEALLDGLRAGQDPIPARADALILMCERHAARRR